MNRALVAVFLLAFAADAAEPEIAARTIRDDVFPKSAAHFADGIIALSDVEYSNIIGFRSLGLDLYTHDEPAGGPARPLVIWVHGGGWDRGDSRTSGAFADFPAVLASLAARGYVVASVNYRLAGEARFPAALRDVKSAIRFLRLNAVRYGINPDKVILWGGSAGGHLAALAAATCGDPAFEPEASTGRLPRSAAEAAKPLPVSDCVQGAVIWYGPFDLVAFAKSAKPGSEQAATLRSLTNFLGCDPASCGAAGSPVTHISASTPPMLLIHGSADKTVPARQSAIMAAELKNAGVRVETMVIPDVDHGLIGSTQEMTRDANLQALHRSYDFMDSLAK